MRSFFGCPGNPGTRLTGQSFPFFPFASGPEQFPPNEGSPPRNPRGGEGGFQGGMEKNLLQCPIKLSPVRVAKQDHQDQRVTEQDNGRALAAVRIAQDKIVNIPLEVTGCDDSVVCLYVSPVVFRAVS